MTKDEVIELFSEHFTEGMVRTIINNLIANEREECAKACEEEKDIDGISTAKAFAEIIRARGQE